MAKRINTYCGPLLDGNRSDLDVLESKGCYLAQRKKDGWWGELTVGIDSHSLISRIGLDIKNTGLNSLNLRPIQAGTKLIVEVEYGTEAANARRKGNDIRAWLHDVTNCNGHDLMEMPYGMRWEILRDAIFPLLSPAIQKRLPLVECTYCGFRDFYDKTIADGDEGVVVKDVNSNYSFRDSNGKTPQWIRIKPWRNVDYFIIEEDYTATGNITVKLGLVRNGKIETVMRYPLADVKLIDGELVRIIGKRKIPAIGQVIEMCGREVFKSGALRSAQPVRWRDDKTFDMCTGLVEYMEL